MVPRVLLMTMPCCCARCCAADLKGSHGAASLRTQNGQLIVVKCFNSDVVHRRQCSQHRCECVTRQQAKDAAAFGAESSFFHILRRLVGDWHSNVVQCFAINDIERTLELEVGLADLDNALTRPMEDTIMSLQAFTLSRLLNSWRWTSWKVWVIYIANKLSMLTSSWTTSWLRAIHRGRLGSKR